MCNKQQQHVFKMNYASIFVSHKSLACMLNMFVHISSGLHFKNNVGFCSVHCNASK